MAEEKKLARYDLGSKRLDSKAEYHRPEGVKREKMHSHLQDHIKKIEYHFGDTGVT